MYWELTCMLLKVMTPSQLVACWIMLEDRTAVSRTWLSNSTLCRHTRNTGTNTWTQTHRHK